MHSTNSNNSCYGTYVMTLMTEKQNQELLPRRQHDACMDQREFYQYKAVNIIQHIIFTASMYGLEGVLPVQDSQYNIHYFYEVFVYITHCVWEAVVGDSANVAVCHIQLIQFTNIISHMCGCAVVIIRVMLLLLSENTQ